MELHLFSIYYTYMFLYILHLLVKRVIWKIRLMINFHFSSLQMTSNSVHCCQQWKVLSDKQIKSIIVQRQQWRVLLVGDVKYLKWFALPLWQVKEICVNDLHFVCLQAANMHSAAFSYETNRRSEYGVRRPDVLVPSGHPGLDGQDSLVLHNALSSVDDNQVRDWLPVFFLVRASFCSRATHGRPTDREKNEKQNAERETITWNHFSRAMCLPGGCWPVICHLRTGDPRCSGWLVKKLVPI